MKYLLVIALLAGAPAADCPLPSESPQWPRSDPRSPVDYDWELFCNCNPEHEFCDD